MTDSTSSTVLVTGGTGFIAGWAIVELLRRGYSVRTTVRSRAKEAGVRAAIARQVDAGDRLSFFEADLTRDDGWSAAVTGCDFVLHVASPLGGATSSAETDLVTPAREGTLRVLRAASAAGVKRIVMTSAAATARPPLDSGRISDETVWADSADPQFDGYRVSKILAERAAWEFMKGIDGTSLTTILPGAVFGPVLMKENLGSVRIIQQMLAGKPPALPRLGFAVVDVRDLVGLHIRAMGAPEAAGQRFLAAGDFMWMEDIARTLRAGLGEAGAKVPTRRLPDFVFRLVARFNPDLRTLAPLLGKVTGVTSEKARRLLQFSPRPAAETIVDTARALTT